MELASNHINTIQGSKRFIGKTFDDEATQENMKRFPSEIENKAKGPFVYT